MKELLDIILPKILPKGIDFITIPHDGKGDLEKSIPIKLRGWNKPQDRFVIVHDQDTNDCLKLKRDLQHLCAMCRKDVLIRIPCPELEAWYFGDLSAVSQAFGRNLTKLGGKKKYRVPDRILNAKEELQRLLPEYGQREGARKIARFMNVEANTSHSFQVFVAGVRRLCGGCNG